MKILYLSTSYVPDRGADSVHVMRMCSALAGAGHDVELVAKANDARTEHAVSDPFAFYGTAHRFTLTRLARPSTKGGGALYSALLVRRLAGGDRTTLVYSRDVVGAWLATMLGYRVCFEAHGLPRTRSHRLALARLVRSRRLARLVTITGALHELLRRDGYEPTHADVLVAPDAADPIDITPPRDVLVGPLRVGYLGHVYPGRGIEILVELGRALPDIAVDVVGGEDRDLEHWRKLAPGNVTFRGFVAPAKLPAIYATFDALVMPYQTRVAARSGSDTSSFMSPMKMFEYMSTARPIVSSNIPVLREVLRHRENALLVEPADVRGWADALQWIRGDWPAARSMGATARSDLLRDHTWAGRATRVLAGIS